MIEIACTQCGKRYKVKAEVQGKRVRCAACKSEFEAQRAVCLMELALMQPSLKLAEAIRTGSLSDLGFFLNHQFTMIQVPGVEGYSPLTCEVKLEGKKFMSIVVFTSVEASGVFAGKNSEMLDEAGELSGFVMDGWKLVKHSPKDVGFLVDPESEHASLLSPADWEPLRKALVRFEREPQLKAAIPQPHPQASAQSHLTDAASNVRNQSFAYLDYMGFQCARWLPAPDMSRQLRPKLEIAGRLAALAGVFAWGSGAPEAIPNRALSDYFKKSSLSKYLTKEEAAIVTTPRQQAMEKHQHKVGWFLENMWPLAWVLGFDSEPDIDGNQIDQDLSMRIIMEFLDKVSISLDDLVRKSKVRTQYEVIAKEDLFYCAHNAVRCAQAAMRPSQGLRSRSQRRRNSRTSALAYMVLVSGRALARYRSKYMTHAICQGYRVTASLLARLSGCSCQVFFDKFLAGFIATWHSTSWRLRTGPADTGVKISLTIVFEC